MLRIDFHQISSNEVNQISVFIIWYIQNNRICDNKLKQYTSALKNAYPKPVTSKVQYVELHIEWQLSSDRKGLLK